MTRNRLLFAVPVCIAFQLAALPVPLSGQGAYGSMDGVTRDSNSKQPVAHVRITAYNVSRGNSRSAVTGSNGTFTIGRLEPGMYQVTTERTGFARSIASVQVSAPETYKVDLLLAAEKAPDPETKAPAVAVQTPIVAMADEIEALKTRLIQLESKQKATT